MQQIIVFGLFLGIIIYVLYRWIRKRNKSGCAHCDFNEEKK